MVVIKPDRPLARLSWESRLVESLVYILRTPGRYINTHLSTLQPQTAKSITINFYIDHRHAAIGIPIAHSTNPTALVSDLLFHCFFFFFLFPSIPHRHISRVFLTSVIPTGRYSLAIASWIIPKCKSNAGQDSNGNHCDDLSISLPGLYVDHLGILSIFKPKSIGLKKKRHISFGEDQKSQKICIIEKKTDKQS